MSIVKSFLSRYYLLIIREIFPTNQSHERRSFMKKAMLFVSLLVATAMLLSACGTAATPTPAPTAVPPTAVPPTAVPPTAVPTATTNPLGTAADPIVMAFAPSTSAQTLTTGGQALADKLKALTGYEFKVTVPTNYAALIEAMGSGNAEVGWLPPAAYIVAKAKGYANVTAVALRNGADHYAFQFIANKARVDDGTFKVYYDPTTGKDTADAATALAQFAGKKPCYTDPLSASGYLVPSGFLASNSIKTLAGAWVQGHPTVVKSVYLSPKGEICDFGATYVPMADVSSTFKDVNDKVVTIWVSDPIIPNDTVAYGTNLPADMQQKITDALVQIGSTPDGLALLKGAGYSWGGVKVVDDSFFDDFRVYLQSIHFDFNNYNG
jgi:phosphonate transport system substrate-binding protein